MLQLIGFKFGKLTYLRIVGRNGTYNLWECLCACGKTVYVSTHHPNTISCGCIRKTNLCGMVFGKLTVSEKYERRSTNIYWECLCECGNYKWVRSDHLTRAKTISCGCYRPQHKHGKSGTPAYRSWCCMLERTSNSDHIQYHRYGGRGITVCEEWKNFTVFLHDMRERPHGTTLNRLDNNKGYFKENCEWSSVKKQNNNKNNNRVLTWKGQSLTASEWSEHLKIPRNRIYSRIKYGLPDDIILEYGHLRNIPANILKKVRAEKTATVLLSKNRHKGDE